jgi:hypothetical protein
MIKISKSSFFQIISVFHFFWSSKNMDYCIYLGRWVFGWVKQIEGARLHLYWSSKMCLELFSNITGQVNLNFFLYFCKLWVKNAFQRLVKLKFNSSLGSWESLPHKLLRRWKIRLFSKKGKNALVVFFNFNYLYFDLNPW